MFRISKQSAKESQDVVGANCLTLRDENIVIKRDMKKKKMERLMNIENVWDGRVRR